MASIKEGLGHWGCRNINTDSRHIKLQLRCPNRKDSPAEESKCTAVTFHPTLHNTSQETNEGKENINAERRLSWIPVLRQMARARRERDIAPPGRRQLGAISEPKWKHHYRWRSEKTAKSDAGWSGEVKRALEPRANSSCTSSRRRVEEDPSEPVAKMKTYKQEKT